MDETPIVFVVEDDDQFRRFLQVLIQSVGLAVETYADAAELLATVGGVSAGCVVSDLRLPGMSGLELQQELVRRGCVLPCLFVSGHGDVPSAVAALKGGAVDFIPKPFVAQHFLDRVHEALRRNRTLRERRAERDSAVDLLSKLSGRERDVLALLVTGQPSKKIASQLGISGKTVESHRASIMKKTGVSHVAELVRLVVSAESEGAL